MANFYEPVTIVVAAHNFYLEQAADGGIILLLCWAFFFGSIVFVCLRTLFGTPRAGDHTDRFLAVGILGGLTGWLLASVFLHLSDFRALLVDRRPSLPRSMSAVGPPPTRAGPSSQWTTSWTSEVHADVRAGHSLLFWPGSPRSVWWV